MTVERSHTDVVVVGGGVVGMTAAFHLLKAGLSVSLIEQYSLGHQWGSSHGSCRITRSTYAHSDYVKLMGYIHRVDWPRLEQELGVRFVMPRAGCFWGPESDRFEKYRSAVIEAGAEVRVIALDEAQKLFPSIRFRPDDQVLYDPTSGIVEAKSLMDCLASSLKGAGCRIHEDTQVCEIESDSSRVVVHCSDKVRSADHLVMAGGPWASKLMPQLSNHLQVARQTVGYFKSSDTPLELDRLPVWVYLGQAEDVYYGLPSYRDKAIRLGRHVTYGRRDDPDETIALEQSEVDDLAVFLRDHFHVQTDDCLYAEHCYYTNTPTEDFVLDRHPTCENIIIAAGFSGHGFKFAPWLGRMIALLVQGDEATDPLWSDVRSRFAVNHCWDAGR